MTCQNAIKRTVYPALALFIITPFLTQASIEKTIMANYDFSTGRSAHYQLQIHTGEKQTTFTMTPPGTTDNTPSMFKVALCLDSIYPTAKHGELRVSAVNTDKKDQRMSNIGYFVSEQNLETWWLHLNEKEDLMFNQDVGGLLVTDPNALNKNIDNCEAR
ncbi:TPA: hypothetical protein MX214_004801 [Citrobacter sedlakii]|nr:hypothetical protein [Citrobacter sedlakii]HCA7081578.1 hypothetical protein [Citrobacter sedlakii]HCA7134852.1 hypothetical protein [Citrobacter sedlakii]HCA7138155.1 hypothetical protein [Citrobacter sedlakii]HCA7180820.1 hypothetical protein [Citrobacter sedlakii]